MTAQPYSRVFTPLRIGPVEVPNRIVRTAHATMFSHTVIHDDHIAYHLPRARAGVGLSILEAAAVHDHAHLGLRCSDDAAIAAYARLVETIRPTGMKLFQQLWHGGHHYRGPQGQPAWGASDIPSVASGIVPVPMDQAMIDEVVQAFARGAARCREGGLDGVEIHAGHGYLVHQFLSPHTNTRTDAYGGSIENRSRFLRDILTDVREAVGPGMAVGMRVSASTLPGGLTEADLAATAALCETHGLIDYLNVSWGDYYEPNRSSAGMDSEAGYELVSSARIVSAVSVPRLIAGRYRTLAEVEQSLENGDADLVAMVRAHIADGETLAKQKTGRGDEVRPCIACNQACIGGLIKAGRMGCVVNPAAGREATLDETLITPAPKPRRVLVVGGGPAGMEAARTAALRGHAVVLAEASSRLGGMVEVARRAPHSAVIGDFTDWQARTLDRLGVDIRLDHRIDMHSLDADAFDAVIVATGSVPRMDGVQAAWPGEPVEGVDLPHVVSSIDVLDGPPRDWGRSAVVLDDLGHYEAIGVAEHLLDAGLAVTYVTRFLGMAPGLNSLGRNDPALRRFYRTGRFDLLVRHHLGRIEPGWAWVRPLLSPDSRAVSADTVVLVSANHARREVFEALRGRVPQLHIVGDAQSPRDLQAAVLEGHLAGRNLH